MSTYEVGQIVYVLSRKERHIIPMQVVEEITRKTRDGNQISYKVAFGPPAEQETMSLSDVDGDVFSNLEAVRAELLSRAHATVETLVTSAAKRSDAWFAPPGAPQVNGA